METTGRFTEPPLVAAPASAAQQLGERVAAAVDAAVERLRAPAADAALAAAAVSAASL